ncbi:Sm domain-containing protein [Pleurotus pulmonarius]
MSTFLPTIMESRTPAQDTTKPALRRLESLLRHVLRISVNDGRIFIEEYRIGLNENPSGRFVGQIMIPWKIVTKVEAQGDATDFENDVSMT